MIALPIAERELRVAARQPRTYRARLAVAAIAVFIFGWMVFLFRNTSWLSGSSTFETFAWLAYMYCLLGGANLSADSISSEKRETTLGLLFLTDLKGCDIVLGKLLAAATNCFFGLLAIFPVLAIPLIMGGVQFAEFWRVCLTLIATLFLSTSVGLAVSVTCRQTVPALAAANLIALFFGFGLAALHEVLRVTAVSTVWLQVIDRITPFRTLTFALEFRPWMAADRFWTSLGTVCLLGLLAFGFSCWALPRVWQERPGSRRIVSWRERWHRFKFGNARQRDAFRRRLLRWNPYLWLASRERFTSLGFLMLSIAIASAALWAGWKVVRLGGPAGPFGSVLFMWAWGVAIIHGLFLFKIAISASHRFSADRESGALELLLATPLPVRKIVAGQWQALARQLAGPILLILFAHSLAVWGFMTIFLLVERSSLTYGDILRATVLGAGGKALQIPMEFIYFLRVFLTVSVVVGFNWVALGWGAMWIGLRAKRPRFAPWIAMAVVLVPPWPVFIGTSIFLVNLNPWWHEFETVLFISKLGTSICVGYALLISAWSAFNLRRHFRAIATDRFQPARAVRRWLWLKRCAVGAAALAVGVTAFYRIERWRGERAWTRLEQEARARGESLDLNSVIPEDVPDDQNFAKAPIVARIFGVRSPKQPSAPIEPENDLTFVELSNLATNTAFRRFSQPNAIWLAGQTNDLRAWYNYFHGTTNGQMLTVAQAATDVLALLSDFKPQLEQLREASRRPCVRFPVNYALGLSAHLPHLDVFREVGQVLNLRACAQLALGQSERALDDVRLILRLAEALRDEPFVMSRTQRLGIMDAALQVIWEGVLQSRWTAEQLASVRRMLASFDLLAEFQKGARNEMILQLTFWDNVRAVAAGQQTDLAGVSPDSARLIRLAYPTGFAYQNKVELYRRFRQEIAPIVDPERQRVFPEKAGDLLHGRPRGPVNPLFLGAGHTALDYIRVQTFVHLAVVACALEHYRLGHGGLPEELGALAPRYLEQLPHDLVTGAPLVYRRERLAPQPFTLYAAGWDGEDNNGNRSSDWVW